MLYWYISLTLALDRDIDRARDLNLARARARALDLAGDLDHKIDHDPSLAQDSPPQTREGIEFFYFALSTTYVVSISGIFALLPQKERSKERIKQFQANLNAWQALPGNPPDARKVIACPSHRASDQEWDAFKDKIYQMAGTLLEIDLSDEWEKDEYKAASNYIQANQLFWDCLQVARVEDREAIEDTILNTPEG